MKWVLLRLYFLAICMFFAHNACAEFIVSLRSPEANGDEREDYNLELVKLALEKTKVEYGDYKIAHVSPMNIRRSIYSLETNIYKNLIIELSYQPTLEASGELNYINFPVDLGITGYRICFISQDVQASLKNIDSVNDLKSIAIGQGFAWADTDILRYNGFNVVEVSNYTSIFNMVANNHVGLFCRGANELRAEYSTYNSIEGLTYDKTFVLFYPLPRFFYVHKKSQLLKSRIEKGLVTAYQDGSIKALWEKHFLNDLKFVNLKQRKLFPLENPYVIFLPKNYAQYFYNPM